MGEPIRRLRGRMIRRHYRTAMGCACAAWCNGYNEGVDDEQQRIARELAAMMPPTPAIAEIAYAIGLSKKLDVAWDAKDGGPGGSTCYCGLGDDFHYAGCPKAQQERLK